jgi:hypothetical protein
VETLAHVSRPEGQDPQEWFTRLFQEFCKAVSFPESWTLLEKVMLFGDLVFKERAQGEILSPLQQTTQDPPRKEGV